MDKERIADNTPLSYIYQENHGYVRELEKEIGEEAVRRLESMGYIENALNSKGSTWRITERAIRRARSIYRSSTSWEKLKDWFYIKVCRINFGF